MPRGVQRRTRAPPKSASYCFTDDEDDPHANARDQHGYPHQQQQQQRRYPDPDSDSPRVNPKQEYRSPSEESQEFLDAREIADEGEREAEVAYPLRPRRPRPVYVEPDEYEEEEEVDEIDDDDEAKEEEYDDYSVDPHQYQYKAYSPPSLPPPAPAPPPRRVRVARAGTPSSHARSHPGSGSGSDSDSYPHPHPHPHPHDDEDSEQYHSSSDSSSASEYQDRSQGQRSTRGRGHPSGAGRPVASNDSEQDDEDASNAAESSLSRTKDIVGVSHLGPDDIVTTAPIVGGKARAFFIGLTRKEVDQVLQHPPREHRRFVRLCVYGHEDDKRLLPREISCARCLETGNPCFIWKNPLATAHSNYRRPCLTCYHRRCSFAEEKVVLHDPKQGWLPGDKDEPPATEQPKPSPPRAKAAPVRKRQIQPRMSGGPPPNMFNLPSPPKIPSVPRPKPQTIKLRAPTGDEPLKTKAVRPRPASPGQEPPAKLIRTANGRFTAPGQQGSTPNAAAPPASEAASTTSVASPPVPQQQSPPAQPAAPDAALAPRPMTDDEILHEHARRQAKLQILRCQQEQVRRQAQAQLQASESERYDEQEHYEAPQPSQQQPQQQPQQRPQQRPSQQPQHQPQQQAQQRAQARPLAPQRQPQPQTPVESRTQMSQAELQAQANGHYLAHLQAKAQLQAQAQLEAAQRAMQPGGAYQGDQHGALHGAPSHHPHPLVAQSQGAPYPTYPYLNRIAGPAARPPSAPPAQMSSHGQSQQHGQVAVRPSTASGSNDTMMGVLAPHGHRVINRVHADSSPLSPGLPDYPHHSPSPVPMLSPVLAHVLLPAETRAAPGNTGIQAPRSVQSPGQVQAARPVHPAKAPRPGQAPHAAQAPHTTHPPGAYSTPAPSRPRQQGQQALSAPPRQANTPPTPVSLDTRSSLPRSPASASGSAGRVSGAANVGAASVNASSASINMRTSINKRPLNGSRGRNAYQVLGVPDPEGDAEWPNASANDAIYRVHQDLFDAFPGVKLEVASPFDREDDPEYDILRPSDVSRVPFLTRITKIDQDLAAVLKDTPRDALPDPEEEGYRLLPPYLYSPRHACVSCVKAGTPCTYAPIRSPPPQRPGFPPPLISIIPLPDCLACLARSARRGKPCKCVHLIQMANDDVHAKLHVLAWGAPPDPPIAAGDDGSSFDERVVWFDPKAAVYV